MSISNLCLLMQTSVCLKLQSLTCFSCEEEVKAERKSITQPPDHWAAFQEAAESEGMTLAEWMSEQCKISLPPRVRKKLSDRQQRGRPKNETE